MKLYEMFPNMNFENMNLECKAVLNEEESKIEKWAKNLSAFSNSGEGHIFIGVDDDFNKRISCQWQVMSYRVQFPVACDDSATPIL